MLLITIIVVTDLLLILIVHLIKNLTLETDKYIIDSTLLAYNTTTEDKTDVDIIKNEIRMFKAVDIEDEIEKKESDTMQQIEAIVPNDVDNTITEKETHEYYVQKLSDSKYKVGSVVVNSYIKQNIDLTELAKSSKISFTKPCKVLIYHTHTSESYTIANSGYSDYYRTENNEYNVVAVGKSLAKYLNNFGFKVVQDATKHDYPSYNGAYRASLATVEKYLKTENFDIILDIHRDALSGNSKFRPTVQINGETAAKIMIVVGTNDAGLEHDNWLKNFKFAIAIQEKGNEMYPGLFRDMHLSTSRYNQHTSDKTLIIEVGATGNTIAETDVAMKYFANVLNSLVNT